MSVKWKLIDEFGVDSFIKLENGELLFEFDFTNKHNLFEGVLGFGDKVKIVEALDIQIEYLQMIDMIRKKY